MSYEARIAKLRNVWRAGRRTGVNGLVVRDRALDIAREADAEIAELRELLAQVVAALTFDDGRPQHMPEGLILQCLDDSWGDCPMSRCAKLVRAALESARKVKP